ncbi:FadR/GntR family transcriptional regulator [Phenylobacterium sp.]|uniref:FadR/GntR family transcriptional regulator n=1 Tax=Phenylobacterium sp. TaxID=1871053 RepID=UPI002F418673
MIAKTEAGRLYEKVAQDLSQKIAAGQYAVGQRLPSERDLAQAYEVSRPTIREAIIALELDGLVEVRLGSGVYVTARLPRGGQAGEMDVGPFELLEARRAIEGESAALAAALISDEELEELRRLVAEMQAENARNVVMSEDADRRFHMLIATATQNSAMVAAVQMLWDARARSPQTQSLSAKAHAAGVTPRIDEHAAILKALRERSPEAARRAMRDHLTRVLESLLAATEVQELEQARARIAAERKRYTTTAR